jgi:hypothetical protein
MTTQEIIKKHIPEFHHWHDHCKEMVINAIDEACKQQRRRCAKRVDLLHEDAYSVVINTKLLDKEENEEP